MTNNLLNRMKDHKSQSKKGFASAYNCNKLVWFEETNDVFAAIDTEKRIKAGSRQKKLDLINEMNPEWEDLAIEWVRD